MVVTSRAEPAMPCTAEKVVVKLPLLTSIAFHTEPVDACMLGCCVTHSTTAELAGLEMWLADVMP